MKLQKLFRTSALTLAAAVMISVAAPVRAAYENTHKNTGNQAADTVAIALQQLGYTESSTGYTKYGAWYGFPDSAWCAMFTSWCLDQAKVSRKTVFPFASCWMGMSDFQKAGIWKESQYLGGSYVPKMGDLIFFDWYGRRSTNHVGIVLYAEDGWVYTVEGNTLANRLDVEERFATSGGSSTASTESDEDMVDKVVVRCRRLDSIYIRGYAVPKYTGTDIPTEVFKGLIDIPADSPFKEEIERVVAAGAMEPMSTYTFGVDFGITRSEYVSVLAAFFGMDGPAAETSAFSDVGTDHPHYDAVMNFRKAGIVGGTANGLFRPDAYITPNAARLILSRLCDYLGIDDVSAGYVGNKKGNYLMRQELAHALCLLLDRGTEHKTFTSKISVNGGDVADVSARNVNGVTYVTAAEWQALLEGTEASFSPENWTERVLVSAPDYWLQEITFSATDEAGDLRPVSSFTANGTRWYRLRDLAAAAEIAVSWDQELNAVALTVSPKLLVPKF